MQEAPTLLRYPTSAAGMTTAPFSSTRAQNVVSTSYGVVVKETGIRTTMIDYTACAWTTCFRRKRVRMVSTNGLQQTVGGLTRTGCKIDTAQHMGWYVNT